jgi:hypothetical protein
MENELLFEHLINGKVSKCLRWADLYRGASVVVNNEHDAKKVSKVELCLLIALDKLKQQLNGTFKDLIEECYDKLSNNPSFDTIDEIISNLGEKHIIT